MDAKDACSGCRSTSAVGVGVATFGREDCRTTDGALADGKREESWVETRIDPVAIGTGKKTKTRSTDSAALL